MNIQNHFIVQHELSNGIKLKTNCSHVIKATIPKLVKICIANHKGQSLSNIRYHLSLSNGQEIDGITDENGYITPFNCDNSQTAILSIKDLLYKLSFCEYIGEDTSDLQSMLNSTGFEAGPLEGNLNNQTKAALRAFQRFMLLQPTGDKDEVTIQLLKNRNGIPINE